MPLPSFRNSRSKVRRRRSHHALKPIIGTVCANCGAPVMPHRACKACGFYKGRAVMASAAKVEKVLAKSTKAAKVTKTATKKVVDGGKVAETKAKKLTAAKKPAARARKAPAA